MASGSNVGLRKKWYAIYMHPQRKGSRMPRLWNIAVDCIVNDAVMEAFKARK